MVIVKEKFGKLESGKEVFIYTLKNEKNFEVKISDYGGIIVSIFTPDIDGNFSDICLGKASLKDYEKGHPYFGALTGRVAGRIGNGKFQLNDTIYNLDKNNGPNCLHGGVDGWHLQVWKSKIINHGENEKLHLYYEDYDGHNNFPGCVKVEVIYALVDNALEITYRAKSDKDTPFNPTNHCYFNLSGDNFGSLKHHEVQIFSNSTAVVNSDMTLTGERSDLVPGINDFRKPVKLGGLSEMSYRNVDTHYFFEEGRTKIPRKIAKISDEKSGRIMEVHTTEPGAQFYAGINLSLTEPDIGKDGKPYKNCGAFCIETQDYPDSVNFPLLGNAILKAGEQFYSQTRYCFNTLTV